MDNPLQLMQQLATQLRQEGKTPSLALFRARLSGRMPPQVLFSTYQQWRGMPVAEQSTDAAPEVVSAEAVQSDDLSSQLQRIEAKLDLLLAKLDKL